MNARARVAVTEALLLRDVLAVLDAGAPRLAYAAWCDDPAVQRQARPLAAAVA